MVVYGYARVSTHGQALDLQVAQLEAAACDRIFREKASGARANRRELTRLLRLVRSGDVVIVTRLDRLARSTRDLLNIVASITDKGAGLRSLGDAWADTTNAVPVSGVPFCLAIFRLATFADHTAVMPKAVMTWGVNSPSPALSTPTYPRTCASSSRFG